MRGKEEYSNFLTKVNDQSGRMIDSKSNSKADALRKKIEDNKKERVKELEALRNKIESLIDFEAEMAKLALCIVDKIAFADLKNPVIEKLEESKILLNQNRKELLRGNNKKLGLSFSLTENQLNSNKKVT